MIQITVSLTWIDRSNNTVLTIIVHRTAFHKILFPKTKSQLWSLFRSSIAVNKTYCLKLRLELQLKIATFEQQKPGPQTDASDEIWSLTNIPEIADLFTDDSTGLWEQDAASCFTLPLLILADAPLVVDNLDKQVVPGCSCVLFCFADGWLRSFSQEPIVAARLAKRPFLPIGVSDVRGSLGGETRRSFDWMGNMQGLSDTSENRDRIEGQCQMWHLLNKTVLAININEMQQDMKYSWIHNWASPCTCHYFLWENAGPDMRDNGQPVPCKRI